MRSSHAALSVCAAFFAACALAYGQSVVAPATDPISPTPSQTPSAPNPGADPDAPTVGHDQISGNDLVNPNNTHVQQGIGVHPDFKTLDINNRGYLTADDVKDDAWLFKNFARCDSNHDGHLSQQEYANCH
jgi:hypothetical protein